MTSSENWSNRYQQRKYPSVFSPWVSAQNLNLSPSGPVTPLAKQESSLATLCRHDVIWNGPGAFGLAFNNSVAGLATGFTRSSVPAGLKVRANILNCNPNAVLAMEIRYRDAPNGYLPVDSPWWKRDAKGQRIVGWKEGGFYLLDYTNPNFQQQVATQCHAAVQSGVVDGCFLDWWSKEDADRLALIRKVRAAIGPSALIIVNANGARPVQSASYINGMYMEGLGASFFSSWQTAAQNLMWARGALAKPAITALEEWYPTPDANTNASIPGRNNVQPMRMVTTLSLVFSDGSVLFGDPNPLPTPDHLHDWYPFWNHQLGKPISAPGVQRVDGSYTREYENGTVVFNPPENKVVSVEFTEPRTSQATGVCGRFFNIANGDGDLFLPENCH